MKKKRYFLDVVYVSGTKGTPIWNDLEGVVVPESFEFNYHVDEIVKKKKTLKVSGQYRKSWPTLMKRMYQSEQHKN